MVLSKLIELANREHGVRWGDAFPILFSIFMGRSSAANDEGPVREFERRFADMTASQFALVMNSGTAALHSALFALGVAPGDEVILPSYTWHATASAVLCCGARPVFCDIDPETLTADPLDIEKKITKKTKAVIVVHVWGNPAKLDKIKSITRAHGIGLVEDCSHAHGASYQGKPVGSWGEIGCFSLQGEKAVSAGEGGIAVCSKKEYFERMLALGHPVRTRSALKNNKYEHLELMHLGPKYRAHLFGVLLALSSLKRLPELNRLRRRNWEILRTHLAKTNGISTVKTYNDSERGGFLGFKFVLNLDALTVNRDDLIMAAKKKGIPLSGDGYGFLHEVGFFKKGGPLCLDLLEKDLEYLQTTALPNTEALRNRIVTLPAFSKMSEKNVRSCAQKLAGLICGFAKACK